MNRKQISVFITMAFIMLALAFLAYNQNKQLQSQSFAKIEPSQEELTGEDKLQTKVVVDNDLNASVSQAVTAEVKEQRDVTVYLTGCVNNPGVFTVPANSRLNDILNIAGGATEEANLLGINLATKVNDGDMYVVPKIGEEIVEIVGENNNTDLKEDNIISNKIDINKASQQQLEQLNGIGPAKATAIIEYRTNNGYFRSIDELISVSGIGEKTLEKIRNDVVAK